MSDKYYDLITTGTAEITRFRQVPVQGAAPYYALTLAILRNQPGEGQKVFKTYVDCTLAGEVPNLVQENLDRFNSAEKTTLTVNFTASDLELKPFTYSSGEKQGQGDEMPKARVFSMELLDQTNVSNAYQPVITVGVGFVNYLKFDTEAGQPRCRLKIAANRGAPDHEDKVAKTYFDCKVQPGAFEMINQFAHLREGDDPKPIMVKFSSTDLEFKPFTYRTGDRAGQYGKSPNTHVTEILWYRVDGNTVFSEAELKRRENRAAAQSAQNQQPVTDNVSQLPAQNAAGSQQATATAATGSATSTDYATNGNGQTVPAAAAAK